MLLPKSILNDCDQLLSTLYVEIDKEFPGLLFNYSPDTYIKLLDNSPKYRYAKFISNDVKRFCEDLVLKHSEKGLDFFHKIILVELIKRNLEKGFQYVCPQPVLDNFYYYFKVIIEDLKKGCCYSGKYMYSQEQFYYHLGVCKQSHIPAGPYIGCLNKMNMLKFPLRIGRRLGVGYMIRNGFKLYANILKIRPYLEIHINLFDRFMMQKFNYEGWKEGYINMAKFLELNPHIKGVVGNSWFYDPQLGHISPELKFLRDLTDEIGAANFFYGTTSCGLKNALFMNKKRRDLYEKGEYVPYNYLIFITREKLIGWANGFK